MNCDELRDLLPDYLAGVLPAATSQALQAHLSACPACGLEVATLEQTWQDLGALEHEAPSEALRASFYARLHAAERRAARRSPFAAAVDWLAALPPLWPRQPLLQLVATAAVLVLGIALGLAARPATTAPVAGPGPTPAPTTVAAPTVAAPPTTGVSPSPAATTTGTPAVRPETAPAGADRDLEALRSEVRSLSHLVALSLLRNESAADRLQGVSYGRGAGASDPRVLEALLEAANHDPNDNVRLAAIDALRPLLGRSAVRDRLLGGFAGQRSRLVQITLVDAVAGSGSGSAAALRSLLARPDLNPEVRQRVEATLAARS